MLGCFLFFFFFVTGWVYGFSTCLFSGCWFQMGLMVLSTLKDPCFNFRGMGLTFWQLIENIFCRKRLCLCYPFFPSPFSLRCSFPPNSLRYIFMKLFEFRDFTGVMEVHQWHVNNSSVITVGYNLYMEMNLWVIGSYLCLTIAIRKKE